MEKQVLPQSPPTCMWSPLSLFEPELVLPEQLESHCHPNRHSGAFRLLWAVFLDGVQTYCRLILGNATHAPSFREAEDWILDDEAVALTSFVNLCQLFNIDPLELREALLEFRRNPRQGVLEGLVRDAA